MTVPTKRARVLLVDDHPAMLRRVADLLASEFDVVSRLTEGSEVLGVLATSQPDIVVLDITLPGGSGIDLARELGATASPPRIVMLTVHGDPDYVREALEAGALGYVLKARLALDLVPALRAALDGRRYVSAGPGFEEWAGSVPGATPVSR